MKSNRRGAEQDALTSSSLDRTENRIWGNRSVDRRTFLTLSQSVGGAAALSSFAGCLGSNGGPDVLNFAHVPTIAMAPIFLAIEEGYYDERNIELELTIETSGATGTAQLASEHLDAMQGAIGPSTFNSIAQDLPIFLVADSERAVPGTPTVVRLWVHGDHYEEEMSLADLPDGATVAINTTGSVVEYILGRELQVNDMTFDDIELTTMPFPDMVSAFESDSIDAAMMTDPNGPQARNTADAHHVAYASETGPNVQVAGILMGNHLVEEDRDLARRFLEAYVLGIREYYDLTLYDDYVVETVSNYLDIPPELIYQTVPNFHHKNAMLNTGNIMNQQEFWDCRGYLEEEPVSEDEAIDQSVLEEALDEVGWEEDPNPDDGLFEDWEENAEGPFEEVGGHRDPGEFPNSNLCN